MGSMSSSPSRPDRLRRIALTVGVAIVVSLGLSASPASAHDDIEGSTPANRSVIDDPISSVDVDFGIAIGENTKLFLTYDPGNGEIVDIGGDTVVTGEETARLDFPELDEQGTYFVQYLAPVPADGHVLAGSLSFSWGAPTALDDSENPDLRTSSPGSREVLDEAITSAEVQFNLEIADDIDLQLVYDRGNGVDFEDLAGTTTKTGPNTATLEFDELPREGTYFIVYDGSAIATGDEIVGATSFIFGRPSGVDDGSFPWLVFGPIALAILGVGAWFSYRRMLVPVDDESTDSELEPA